MTVIFPFVTIGWWWITPRWLYMNVAWGCCSVARAS